MKMNKTGLFTPPDLNTPCKAVLVTCGISTNTDRKTEQDRKFRKRPTCTWFIDFQERDQGCSMGNEDHFNKHC